MNTKPILPMSHNQSKRRAYAILGVTFGVVTGAIALFVAAKTPSLDEVTLCPKAQRLTHSTVILVDTTDAFTNTQGKQLLSVVRTAQNEVPTYGKLTLVLLNANAPYEPQELVSLCNPGSPSHANPLTQTVSRVEKQWKNSFDAPISRALRVLISAPTAARSPILESIAALTSRPDFDHRVSERRLLIVSDMLQHTPGEFSHYSSRGLWKAYIQSALFQDTWADLKNVAVDIEYLRRAGYGQYQKEEQRNFWRHWFKKSGAKVVRYFGVPQQLDSPTTQFLEARVPK